MIHLSGATKQTKIFISTEKCEDDEKKTHTRTHIHTNKTMNDMLTHLYVCVCVWHKTMENITNIVTDSLSWALNGLLSTGKKEKYFTGCTQSEDRKMKQIKHFNVIEFAFHDLSISKRRVSECACVGGLCLFFFSRFGS